MNSDVIAEKLDVLIKLQALTALSSLGSSKEKVLLLNSIGLKAKQIEDITGIPGGSVRSYISQEKKKDG